MGGNSGRQCDMSGILGALGGAQTGGSQSQCDPVVINPSSGTVGDTILLTCATSGSHIFYTKTITTGVDPTHAGDNPTGVTIRNGTNSFSTGAPGNFNHNGVIRALAYKSGLLDSIISEGNYDAAGGPGD